MEQIPVDKVAPEFWAAIAMFGVLTAIVKWMISQYFKLVHEILEMKDRDNKTINRACNQIEACLNRLEGGVRHNVNDGETAPHE